MAEENKDFVIGFICVRNLTSDPTFVHMTPGMFCDVCELTFIYFFFNFVFGVFFFFFSEKDYRL